MAIKKLVDLLLLPLNCLLLFFLVFESRLHVPAWLQVFGRMHPIMLHFPIVLMLIYGGMILLAPARFKNEHWFIWFTKNVLLLSAITAAITALMGLLLSKEPGYDADAIAWHKYTGIALSFLLFGLYSFHQWLEQHLFISKTIVLLSSLLIIWAGHMGANITHGENFMMAPVMVAEVKPAVAFEDAVVYTDLIEPIFAAKCMGCHNESKAKGQLIMSAKELLLKGGKSGVLWDTSKPEMGLMLHRINLPEDDKKHMPPAGKQQLTDIEQQVLYAWIKGGSMFDTPVMALPPHDTLRLLAASVLKQAGAVYTFNAAKESDIAKLTNNNRQISPVSLGSPALVVNFYNRSFFNSDQLKELLALKDQVVELNLDNMPVQDGDIKLIGQFKNLNKLNLNNSSVTGKTFGDLKTLVNLKHLSVSGTAVSKDGLKQLIELPKLRTVTLWNTTLNSNDIDVIAKANKNINYYAGFSGDTVVLKLTPPIFKNDSFIIFSQMPLLLKHYIKGTSIRYTLDGSQPDSLRSLLYTGNEILKDEVTVKTKAYKPGWITSDSAVMHFFKSTYKADSAILFTKPDDKYKGKGGKTLIDLEKSEQDFGNGQWLGYRERPLDAGILFNTPIDISSVTLSMAKDLNGYVFPPVKIELWCGSNKNNLNKVFQLTPPPQKKDTINNYELISFKCDFKKVNTGFVKVVVTPVAHLPAWHKAKGEKGWVFIDEIFFN